MRAIVTTFAVAKAGSTWLEYEDAAGAEPTKATSGATSTPWLAVAVADGASEALLAGRWAKLLVNQFTEADPSSDLATNLAQAAAGWDETEADYRQGRDEAGEPIAWYEEDGLRRGAYATLVGARLFDGATEDTGPLLAWALGDACLFLVRDDTVVASFPIDDPGAFGTSPPLAPSRPLDAAKVRARIEHLQTTWRRHDRLFLVSDALACWFLTRLAAGDQPWQHLQTIGTPDGSPDFATWVDDRRTEGAIRNDDTTLLRVDLL